MIQFSKKLSNKYVAAEYVHDFGHLTPIQIYIERTNDFFQYQGRAWKLFFCVCTSQRLGRHIAGIGYHCWKGDTLKLFPLLR